MTKDAQEAALVAAKDKLVASYVAAHNALGEFVRILNTADIKIAAKHIVADSSALAIFSGPHLAVTYVNGKKRGAASSGDEDSDGDGKKKRKKQAKKDKDPNAPKRPASAFILFQNAVRAEMRAQNPDIQHSELAKQIGERWRALSEEEKKPWSETGRSAMEEWNVKRKAYDEEHPELKAQLKSPTLKSLDELRPDGEKPKKKRGRPSNVEIAARAPQAKSTTAEAKKDKKEKVAAPKKSSAPPPPAQSSSEEGSDEEDAEDDGEEEEEDEADELEVQAAPKAKAPVAVQKKAVAPPKAAQVSSGESEEEEDDEEESVKVAPPLKKAAVASTQNAAKKAEVVKEKKHKRTQSTT